MLDLDQLPTLMTPAEAAKMLNLAQATLDRWRHEGKGPPYIKLGTIVRYDAMELIDWLKAQTVQTTRNGNK